MGWIPLISVDKVREGEKCRVEREGKGYLVVRLNGRFAVYDDSCPHEGVPLSTGRMVGSSLVCSAHGWCFDVESGRGVRPVSACLRRHDVRVVGERIELFVEEKSDEQSQENDCCAREE